MSETFKALMVAHGSVIQELVENDGEVTPEQEEVFKSLMTKVDGLESFRQALDGEETRFDMMIKMLSSAKKRVCDRKAWLDQYVIANLRANGVTEIAGEMIKLVIQANPPSVVIDSEALIPNGFMKIPEPVPPKAAPDKKAIGEMLKSGKEVPGARLVQGVRLVAKANSILVKSKAVTA